MAWPSYHLLFPEGQGGSNRKKIVIIAFAVVIVIIIVAVSLVVALSTNKTNKKQGHHYDIKPSSRLPPTADEYKTAAVAADSFICSSVGTDTLKKGGNAMDAMIASLFCVGVVNMHSTGIGGGGFLMYYNRKKKKAVTYDSRETAPAKATEDMYMKNVTNSKKGGLATGVPGEVIGLYRAWKDHGRLNWSDLVQPSIVLASKGFPLPIAVHDAMVYSKEKVANDPGLRALLLNKDGNMKQSGDLILNIELGETLKKIQKNPNDFYNGSLASQIVQDIHDASGIVTLEDLKNYKFVKKDSLTTKLNMLDLHITPLPSGGPVFGMITKILQGYGFTSDDLKTTSRKVETYHKMIESFKWANAHKSILGDPAFLPDNITKIVSSMLNQSVADYIRKHKILPRRTHDYSYYKPWYGATDEFGTSHVSILDQDGNAASATHTINWYFGAGYRSLKTGIIYNNEMNDFSLKMKYKSNIVRPGKRPLSSMSPVIITDKNGDVKMVIGASGGSKITTAMAIVIFKTLLMDVELAAAISEPRFHNVFSAKIDVKYEKKWPLAYDVRKGLERMGHKLEASSSKAVVQAIYIKNSTIYAYSDPRKHGRPAGY